MEAKSQVKHCFQAIGIVVLSSFIENNLHPLLNSMVPRILVNCKTVQVLLYDCRKDVLFITEKVRFIKEGQVIPNAILFMWFYINHRYVADYSFYIIRV